MTQHPISFMLFSLARAVQRTVNDHLAQHGLNTVEAKILGILIHHQGTVCQRDICKAFGTSRSATSGVLDTMERNGLITRSGDQGDRRRNNLSLTDKGREIAHVCEAVMDEVDQTLYDCLGEQDYRTVQDVIVRLRGALTTHEQDTAQAGS
jgi:DNA-binding MarR family transcriptional regulator